MYCRTSCVVEHHASLLQTLILSEGIASMAVDDPSQTAQSQYEVASNGRQLDTTAGATAALLGGGTTASVVNVPAATTPATDSADTVSRSLRLAVTADEAFQALADSVSQHTVVCVSFADDR